MDVCSSEEDVSNEVDWAPAANFSTKSTHNRIRKRSPKQAYIKNTTFRPLSDDSNSSHSVATDNGLEGPVYLNRYSLFNLVNPQTNSKKLKTGLGENVMDNTPFAQTGSSSPSVIGEYPSDSSSWDASEMYDDVPTTAGPMMGGGNMIHWNDTLTTHMDTQTRSIPLCLWNPSQPSTSKEEGTPVDVSELKMEPPSFNHHHGSNDNNNSYPWKSLISEPSMSADNKSCEGRKKGSIGVENDCLCPDSGMHSAHCNKDMLSLASQDVDHSNTAGWEESPEDSADDSDVDVLSLPHRPHNNVQITQTNAIDPDQSAPESPQLVSVPPSTICGGSMHNDNHGCLNCETKSVHNHQERDSPCGCVTTNYKNVSSRKQKCAKQCHHDDYGPTTKGGNCCNKGSGSMCSAGLGAVCDTHVKRENRSAYACSGSQRTTGIQQQGHAVSPIPNVEHNYNRPAVGPDVDFNAFCHTPSRSAFSQVVHRQEEPDQSIDLTTRLESPDGQSYSPIIPDVNLSSASEDSDIEVVRVETKRYALFSELVIIIDLSLIYRHAMDAS